MTDDKLTPEKLGRLLWEASKQDCEMCKFEMSTRCSEEMPLCLMFVDLLDYLNTDARYEAPD